MTMRVLSQAELQGAATGTSFYNDTFYATPQELIELIGPPTYDNNKGEDKVNLEWVCKNEYGETVTIYDWKHYRPLDMNKLVHWHLGAKDGLQTGKAKRELQAALQTMREIGSWPEEIYDYLRQIIPKEIWQTK
jgi:hypothetical protein